MTPRLTTDYAKNYCNRILIVKVIVENVVTFFMGHSVEFGKEQQTKVLFVFLLMRTFQTRNNKTSENGRSLVQ